MKKLLQAAILTTIIAVMLLPAAALAADAITVEINGISYGATSLDTAITAAIADAGNPSVMSANTITSIEVTAGSVTAWDWDCCRSWGLTELQTLTVDAAVTPVADIPDSFSVDYHTDIPILKALQSVSICNTQAIGNEAFRNNTFTTASFPDAKTIYSNAFAGCSVLSSVSFPCVTSIGSSAFYDCPSLTTVSFPSVESIGADAFFSCENLATLSLPAKPPTVENSDVFFDCPRTNPLIFVNADGTPLTGAALNEAIDAYKAVEDDDSTDDMWYGWNLPKRLDFAITVKINGKAYGAASLEAAIAAAIADTNNAAVTSLADITSLEVTEGNVTAADWDYIKNEGRPDYRFPLPSLKTLIVGSGVTSVADLPSDFLFTPNSVSTKLPIEEAKIAIMTRVGMNAFTNCTSLTTAEFPDATHIYNSAFRSCSSLKAISLPKATNIEGSAFYDCSALETVSFPQTTSIDSNVFVNCSSLKTADLPEATSIGSMAFTNCSSLTTASFPKVTSIDMWTFSGCSMLVTTNFPEVTSIGNYAFSDCSSLETVSFPKATSIGEKAFMACSSLNTASFPKATSIGSKAFDSCDSLLSLSLPANPPTVTDSNAFSYCPYTRSLTPVDGDGNALTGQTLNDAITAYEQHAGYDSAIGTWYGWTLPARVILAATVEQNGTSTDFSSFKAAWAAAQALDTSINPATVTLLKDVSAAAGNAPASWPITMDAVDSIILNLNDHVIDRGLTSANWYGNVITVFGNLTLRDGADNKGKITGGHNYYSGGGVRVEAGGTFYMEGGSITNNNTGTEGGGVHVNGTFNMSGGSISNNTGAAGAGGVYAYGVFNMEGGSITNNSNGTEGASGTGVDGGGVYVFGIFNMSGGSITSNNVHGNGGGVYVNVNGAFTVSGKAVIEGNTHTGGAPDNVNTNTEVITIGDGGLTDGASIGVTTQSSPTAGTPVDITNAHAFGDMSGYFFSDKSGYMTVNTDTGSGNSKVQLALESDAAATVEQAGQPKKTYITFAAAWADATARSSDENNPVKVTLLKEVSQKENNAPASWPITVTQGKYIELDLNGHNIDATGSNTRALNVNGTLTLMDNAGGGKITGGKLDGSRFEQVYGGGVFVDGGTFNMKSGIITQNSLEYGNGGGVYIKNLGEFNLSGGIISNNTATIGGGVYLQDGNVYMSGGSITQNKAERLEGGGGNAGGLYMQSGNVYMSGGSISGNIAEDFTGGVGRYDGGLYLSGKPTIEGNMAWSIKPSNVAITGAVIMIDDSGLEPGASIGVTLQRLPTAGNPMTITNEHNFGDMSAYFFSDVEGYTAISTTEGCAAGNSKVQFKCADPVATVEQSGTSTDFYSFKAAWAYATGTLDTSTDPATVTLLKDVDNDPTNANAPASWPITVDAGDNIILDLNDHVINRGLTSAEHNGNVITVNGNLTLCDSGNDKKGEIRGGYSIDFGGGVLVFGTFNMEGGSITKNRTESYGGGGGVYVFGIFNMKGGSILYNSAFTFICGGGVCVADNGAFTMTDGSITNNSATSGGGVYGAFTVSGKAVIKDNTGSGGVSDNACIDTAIITIGDGGLTAGASIGVSKWPYPTAGNPIDITNAHAFGDMSGYFFSDKPEYTTINTDTGSGNSKVQLALAGDAAATVEQAGQPKKTYITFSAAWAAAMALDTSTDPATVTLLKDVSKKENNEPASWPITVPVGKSITLDLNGRTIDRGLTEGRENGHVIHISDGGAGDATTFTITDTSTSGDPGKITGGRNTGNGGGVYVGENRILALSGRARITGNQTVGETAPFINGGGVYVAGTLNMTGGEICNNNGYDSAGGAYVTGTLNMTGGAIHTNSTNGEGGGVFLVGQNSRLSMSSGASIYGNKTVYSSGGGVNVKLGTFEMSDGAAIYSNSAGIDGGGVSLDNGSFNMSGGTIYENRSDDRGGGVHIPNNGGVFNMSGTASIFRNTSGDYGGGGVCVREGVLNMSGNASITENTTQNSTPGGGVWLTDGGKLSLADAAKISGNVMNGTVSGGALTGGTANNLWLSSGKTATIASALTSGADISVTTAVAPTGAAPVPVTGDNGADYSAYFSSDKAGYDVINIVTGSEQALYLIKSEYTITYMDKGGAAFSGTHEAGYPTAHTYGADTPLKGAEKQGYKFGGWYIEKDCSGTALTSLAAYGYHDDITLYTDWTAEVYGITYDLQGGALEGGKTNPASYTVEDDTFTLNNPILSGAGFAGWTGTGITSPQLNVTIAKGSVGDRTYTATWSRKASVTIDQTPITATYDGQPKPFTVKPTAPTPATLTGFKVEYRQDGSTGTYTDTAPSAIGVYDVRVTRAEDAAYIAFSAEIAKGLTISSALISTAAITDVELPVAGATPSAAAVCITPGVGATGGAVWTPNDATFVEGTSYTVSVTLTAAAGSAFAAQPTVTINGLAATVTSVSAGSITVSYTFPAVSELTMTIEPGGSFEAFNATDLKLVIGKGTGLTPSDLKELSIDGKPLTDGAEYTKSKGSIVITLKKEYLNTLTPGIYTLRATVKSGAYAEARLTVFARPPKTGDSATPYIWLGLCVLCGVAIGFVIRWRRKG